jgi:hypothetical protein
MNADQFLKILSKEIHTTIKRKFKRRQVFVKGKNDCWSMDLVEMQPFANKNKGFRYMITCIDVFTRYAWAIGLKTKESGEVLDAFKKIVAMAGEHPKRIWVDQGGEFYNKQMKTYREQHKIEIYSTYGEHKSMMVERFNRTLKTIMWKKFTEQNNKVWHDILDTLLEEYNNRKHSSIETTPYKAYNNDMAKDQYDDDIIKAFDEPKYEVKDFVRISKDKGKFAKGYEASWSKELFIITSVLKTNPVTYKITDYDGETIQGSFYEEELINSKIGLVYIVEKILKKRKRKSENEQAFVKWLGRDEKENSWIDAKKVKVGTVFDYTDYDFIFNIDPNDDTKDGQIMIIEPTGNKEVEEEKEEGELQEHKEEEVAPKPKPPPEKSINTDNIIEGKRKRKDAPVKQVKKVSEIDVAKQLHEQFFNKDFMDENEKFTIKKVYWDKKRKKRMVDYVDKKGNTYFSLWNELSIGKKIENLV